MSLEMRRLATGPAYLPNKYHLEIEAKKHHFGSSHVGNLYPGAIGHDMAGHGVSLPFEERKRSGNRSQEHQVGTSHVGDPQEGAIAACRNVHRHNGPGECIPVGKIYLVLPG